MGCRGDRAFIAEIWVQERAEGVFGALRLKRRFLAADLDRRHRHDIVNDK